MAKNDFKRDGTVREFFGWINERQSIYVRRQNGEPWPWTKDKILQDFFFTNVFREQDKVTVWVRENWRNNQPKTSWHTLIFNLTVARFFNYIPTLERIGYIENWPQRRKKVERDLLKAQEDGHKIFNDAYVIAGTDLAGKNKITGICDRLDSMWRHLPKLVQGIMKDRTLMKTWWWLQEVPGIGPFIAYEIVTDLRHTPLLQEAPDIMTWANPGPGAKRGLQRIYGKNSVGDKNEQINLMHNLLEISDEFTELKLEMRDIEHSLCEYDKYKRIKLGQGVVRRYRRGS